jgi:hypothetical protein
MIPVASGPSSKGAAAWTAVARGWPAQLALDGPDRFDGIDATYQT